MGSWSNRTGVLIWGGRDTRNVHAQRKTIRGHSEKATIYKPRRKASGETKPDNTLILDFQQELMDSPLPQSVLSLRNAPLPETQGNIIVSNDEAAV